MQNQTFSKPDWQSRLGWGLVLISVPVWCLVFLAPFLPLSLPMRTSFGAGAILLGEVLFWVGLLLLGPAAAARLKAPKVTTGKSFAGKHIGVVGATGGLGLAIVEALAREKAEISAFVRNSERLAVFNLPLDIHNLDLEKPESITAAAQAIEKLDALVVAVGVDIRKPFLSQTEPDMSQQITLNLLGAFRLVQAFAPQMRPGGIIAFVGGFGNGRLALPYYSVDVATRAGLAAFCESLNREFLLEGQDLRLAYLCPEPAETETERPYAEIWKRMGTPPVAPAQVANFVLRSLLSQKQVAVMGIQTMFISKINALWPAAANVLGLRQAGKVLHEAFGSQSSPPSPL